MYFFSTMSRKIVTIALLLMATTQFTNALDSDEMPLAELDGRQEPSTTRHLRGQHTIQESRRKLVPDLDKYFYCVYFPQECFGVRRLHSEPTRALHAEGINEEQRPRWLEEEDPNKDGIDDKPDLPDLNCFYETGQPCPNDRLLRVQQQSNMAPNVIPSSGAFEQQDSHRKLVPGLDKVLYCIYHPHNC